MSTRAHRRILTGLTLLLAAAALLAPYVAYARPGGGESYGGGSDGGGGGGGSGGGGNIGLIIQLILFTIEHPILGGIIIIILIGVHTANRYAGGQDLDVGAARAVGQTAAATPQLATRRDLDALRNEDPAFSAILFEDFLHLLYGELQRARARGAAARIGPYASPEVAALVAADPRLERVEGVIVGALHYRSFQKKSGFAEVVVDIEANVGEVRGNALARLYVVDRLTIRRSLTAKSRPRERLAKLDCPSCGAPLDALRGTRCTHCGQDAGNARFDWTVSKVGRLKQEARPPLLTGEVDERGTDLPTVIDPNVARCLDGLRRRDPAFDPAAFTARVGVVFNELNAAWSARDLSRGRAFVSDSIFESFQYWMDVYEQARARNVVEDAVVVHVDLANIATDPVFDAITVRLFARGKDYVITDQGRVLKGSKSRVRSWSEYWTFIRGHVTGRPTRTDANCPNCGAPIAVDVTGTCTYCRAKISSGDFDWVLSRIEQDESYRG